MADINLYVHNIPGDDLTSDSTAQSPRSNVAGLLNQDGTTAERISAPPGDFRVRAQHRGRFADLMAEEVDELARSSSYSPIPIFVPGQNQRSLIDGFYIIENSTIGAVDPRERRIQDVDLSVSQSGTRANKYRAVRSDGGLRQVTHPFGSANTAELGLPATATDVYWVNPETGAATAANRVATRTGERGDINIYDAVNAPVSDPILVFDAPYDASSADVYAWDSRGLADRDTAAGIIQWQRVFIATHDFGGDARVLSNGLLRLTLDPQVSPGISAERYDAATGAWTAVSLGSSAWSLTDIDIANRTSQQLAPTRADARTRWTDGTSTYALDMTLHRGQDVAQFDRSVTQPSSGVPSGLQTLLDPIASTSIRDPQQSQALRPRSEVDV
jgi:hypothetical protein